MGWATTHIKRLQEGETVTFRPHGNSMVPLIKSGELVTVEPVDELEVGDIVLVKVNGRQFLHKVTALKDGQVQISNNKGHINGWTGLKNVFGKCTKVEP